jgi:hypothetical protein
MALKITIVARQWLSGDHVDNPRETNAEISLQQRNGVFCAVPAEMLLAEQVRSCNQ